MNKMLALCGSFVTGYFLYRLLDDRGWARAGECEESERPLTLEETARRWWQQ